MSSWTKKMPDFAGHSYFFENEIPSFFLPTKKRPFKQEPTEKTELLPLTHFLRCPARRGILSCSIVLSSSSFSSIFPCALCGFAALREALVLTYLRIIRGQYKNLF
jgi:hypothetical protein